MSFESIQIALAKQLDATIGIPTIFWPGVENTPTHSVEFVRPTVIPAKSTLLVLDSTQDNSGMYQIDIYAPLRRGEACILDSVTKIHDKFKSATTLTEKSTIVFVKAISILPIEKEDAWLRGGITIEYKSIE